VCIGALGFENNESLRLLHPTQHYQPTDTPFSIGDIWEVDLRTTPHIKPPHTEDVVVVNQKFISKQNNLKAFLEARVRLFRGSPEILFDELINFKRNGSTYISQRPGVPSYSTCFWIPDRDLVEDHDEHGVYYLCHRSGGSFRIKYVGLEKPVDIIAKSSLVRISLSRWWRPDDNSQPEKRCYLQLSGWYV
jgi:putative nucleic acid modification protein with dual OB domain